MKISRRKVIELGNILMQAEKLFKSPITGKFFYAVAKNREIAKEEYKLYIDANPYPPQYDEYKNKQLAIMTEVGESAREGFGKLDPQTQNMILNSLDPKVMPTDKRELLLARIAELDGQYKDLLEEVKTINDRSNEFLDEEDDFAIKTVKLAEIPEIVSGNGYEIMLKLDPMIVEG